jgi:hypothetical protein
VAAQVYQHGVDQLSFRSEKKFAGGRVVMEVHYDRGQPDRDCFSMRVFDLRGQLVREERYQRQEIKEASRDLHFNKPPPADGKPESPELAQRRAVYEARWTAVLAMFPARDRDEEE